jgi:ribosomal-protein-alanine N-acetyltransferase
VGDLVYLRYPMPRDREAFVDLRRSSRGFLERWEPRPPRGFNAWGDDQFEWMLKTRRKPEQERLFIFDCETRALVGQISLGVITRGPLQSAYMGYWIGEAFAGRGYMTEAIRLMLTHAFRTVGLHRVEANIQPDNDPSKAVAKKCGLRLEGYSPKYLKINGQWSDHERWAITLEDWREDSGRTRATRARSRAST